MSNRGQLTPALIEKSRSFLGRCIDTTELRLYPYLQYAMLNARRIDPAKINAAERDVLRVLREEKHIEGGASGLAMTREFYMFICDILFDAYAAYDNPELNER